MTLLRLLPTIFYQELDVMSLRDMIGENQVPSKKSLGVQKGCVSVAKHCCYDKQTDKHKFSSKGLKKITLEECGDSGPMPKYRKVLEEAVNVTSSNRGLRTTQHSVATYEQTMKGRSYSYPKRIEEEDGIHTKSLPL